MDEMKLNLSTEFMRGLISSLITRVIRRKLGHKVDVRLNELSAEVVNGQVRLHVNVDAKLDSDELKTIIESIG